MAMISRENVRESPHIFNEDGEEIFMAGQWAKGGFYRQLDSTRVIHHQVDGPLPASFDGHRAAYCRFERPWINLNGQSDFQGLKAEGN
jgi:hypothetical protein